MEYVALALLIVCITLGVLLSVALDKADWWEDEAKCSRDEALHAWKYNGVVVRKLCLVEQLHKKGELDDVDWDIIHAEIKSAYRQTVKGGGDGETK